MTAADHRTIDVLLSPRLTLVVDVFRALGDFEASYDIGVIDAHDGQVGEAVQLEVVAGADEVVEVTRAGEVAYGVVVPPLPEPAAVRLVVYDVLGRAVAVPVDAWRTAGPHEAVLDVTSLASGVYVCRLEAGRWTQSQALIVRR